MAAPVTRSLNPAIREASRGLVEARDDQVAQIVAMVDAMPDRGAADHLIAPLRARLARTRPPRPLRFARLLFLPLDPLLASSVWRGVAPPCMRQRPFGMAGPLHGLPARVLAPHLGAALGLPR